MSFMTWNENLVTGIDIVDSQHHGLVDLVNQAAPVLARKSKAKLADLEPIFAALTNYAAVHFKTEEDLMRQYGVDARVFEHHHQTHEQFVSHVLEMVESFKSDKGVTGDELLSFLAGWLVFHILGEDQTMSRQIHAIERGMQPALAYAEAHGEQLSPLPTAETRVLVDLYTQLSQQNEELEIHRSVLENLVYERTKELEKLAEDLRQSRDAAIAGNVAKSRFLGTMSHELRTPMNAILGYSKLLASEGLSPDQRPLAKKIIAASDHLLEIINDLIEYSRLDAGQHDVHIEAFQLKSLLLEYCQRAFTDAKTKGLSVKVEIDPQIPLNLLGDARHIGKVLKQFATNACKFTDQGGITLQVSRRGPTDAEGKIPIRFAMRDTGIGIAKEAQAHLFGAFEQLDDRPERKYEGLGLGLALARQLGQHMDGDVGVESELGKGSLFWLDVALAKAPDQPAAAPPSPAGKPVPTVSPAAPGQAAVAPLPADFKTRVAQLDKLLGEDDTSANELFEAMQPMLARAYPDRIDELAGQIAGFAFDQALRILRELAKRPLP